MRGCLVPRGAPAPIPLYAQRNDQDAGSSGAYAPDKSWRAKNERARRRADGFGGRRRTIPPSSGFSKTFRRALGAHVGGVVGWRCGISRTRDGVVRRFGREQAGCDGETGVVVRLCARTPWWRGDAEFARGAGGRIFGDYRRIAGCTAVCADYRERRGTIGNVVPGKPREEFDGWGEAVAEGAGESCGAVAGEFSAVFATGAFEAAVR